MSTEFSYLVSCNPLHPRSPSLLSQGLMTHRSKINGTGSFNLGKFGEDPTIDLNLGGTALKRAR